MSRQAGGILCDYCGHKAIWPHRLLCGHKFCWDPCIRQFTGPNQFICPLCFVSTETDLVEPLNSPSRYTGPPLRPPPAYPVRRPIERLSVPPQTYQVMTSELSPMPPPVYQARRIPDSLPMAPQTSEIDAQDLERRIGKLHLLRSALHSKRESLKSLCNSSLEEELSSVVEKVMSSLKKLFTKAHEDAKGFEEAQNLGLMRFLNKVCQLREVIQFLQFAPEEAEIKSKKLSDNIEALKKLQELKKFSEVTITAVKHIGLYKYKTTKEGPLKIIRYLTESPFIIAEGTEVVMRPNKCIEKSDIDSKRHSKPPLPFSPEDFDEMKKETYMRFDDVVNELEVNLRRQKL